jgi:hypothetical protein
MGKPTIRNWRDIQPRVGHDNAIVWNILRPVGATAPPQAEMEHLIITARLG